MAIKIQNRLEILRGNKIIVPGCEPTSAFTSPTLAENRECTASVVDLADAITAIPNATIVSFRNPRTRFLCCLMVLLLHRVDVLIVKYKLIGIKS